MKVKWRDDSGNECETEIDAFGRCEVAEQLAQIAHRDSAAEAYREGGGWLEILEPAAFAGRYKIVTDYEPVFTAFLDMGGV